MPLLWASVAPPNRSLSLCLKSVKNLYLSHRFFCKIRQIQLRLKKWCKAISLLPSSLHYATSLQTLKSLSITCKRWLMVSCVHDPLFGGSSFDTRNNVRKSQKPLYFKQFLALFLILVSLFSQAKRFAIYYTFHSELLSNTILANN